MRALTAERMRAVERAWMARSGEDAAQLMERAAAGAMAVAQGMARSGPWVAVCGPGHNGGDGLAMARMHAVGGGEAHALIVHIDRMSELTAFQRDRAVQAGVRVCAFHEGAVVPPPGLIIDALLGTGTDRAVEGDIARAVGWIGLQGTPTLSVDVPSGLDATRGVAWGPAVHADATAAMGWPKTGLLFPEGRVLAGRVTSVPLGIPEDALSHEDAEVLGVGEASRLMPGRPLDGHKGTFGRVLVIAGRSPYAGAAALCALGALRGGAGLVRVLTDRESLGTVRAAAPETVSIAWDEADTAGEMAACDALCAGPGLGDAPEIVEAMLSWIGAKPLLFDADALNTFARHGLELPRGCVVTPHPGEMARLIGVSADEVTADPVGLARSFARDHRCTVLLKGSTTVIAHSDGRHTLNLTGNPGMATGGSGDVLTGVIAALMGQGMDGYDAARLGAWLHGRAGGIAARRHGMRGLIAGDIARSLGAAWRGLERAAGEAHRIPPYPDA